MKIEFSILTLCAAVLICVPLSAAGYGESAYYGQGTYYGESAYYAQSSYYAQSAYAPNITFTTPLTIQGDLNITGTIGKGSGTFVIDHPLDPLNKLLYHSFVESPDAKNIYDGIATLNAEGEVSVVLPAYFVPLSKDVRYQLKPLSQAMPNLHIKKEIRGATFEIGGGVPGGRVSWQITAVRNDPYIRANPIRTEVKKGEEALVGVREYLYPRYYEDNSLFKRLSKLFTRIGADR